jgi:hypothetical protein
MRCRSSVVAALCFVVCVTRAKKKAGEEANADVGDAEALLATMFDAAAVAAAAEWVDLLVTNDGVRVEADTYATYRFPVAASSAYTIVGFHSVLPPGHEIHHMKLMLETTTWSVDAVEAVESSSVLTSVSSRVQVPVLKNFAGYDGIASGRCAPPPFLFPSDAGVVVQPGDTLIVEIHNNVALDEHVPFQMGFRIATSPVKRARAINNFALRNGDFALAPGRFRITVSSNSAAEHSRYVVAHSEEGSTLVYVHGHFHRRGIEQVFYVNGEAIGSWRPPPPGQPHTECPAPPAYAHDPGMVRAFLPYLLTFLFLP